MQLRDVRVKLLYHLFYRPLPGEEVWLVSLAEALGVEYGVLVEQLKVCHIEIARTRGADYILVPGPDFLRDMLSDDGFDTDILDPLEALVDGDYFGIRWMELVPGQCTFCAYSACRSIKVTWKGKRPVSTVCSRTLNPAARHYVSWWSV